MKLTFSKMRMIKLSLLLVIALLAGAATAQDAPPEQEISIYTNYSSPMLLLQTSGNLYELGSAELNEIDPEWIDGVQVFKDETAAQFGEKGKNGVVILTFKGDVKEAKKYARAVRRHKEKVASPLPEGVRQ